MFKFDDASKSVLQKPEGSGLLAQVSAWEARGKLPLGADMTAAIQRMRLRDLAHTSPGQRAWQGLSAEQESMLRMQYALAIVRLVNGISDSAQKGTVAKSVANLAESAGAHTEFLWQHARVPLVTGTPHIRNNAYNRISTPAPYLSIWCDPAGLPRLLVDIRHEASHNELPSLALLRLGATSALAWLSQSYWQQQADHLTLRKSQIHELLRV